MITMTPAIAVTRVAKTYGTGSTAVRALVDVSLEVLGGEVLLMMGPSGSGKTTLLSIMGGILDASSGSVRVRGEELVGLPERGQGGEQVEPLEDEADVGPPDARPLALGQADQLLATQAHAAAAGVEDAAHDREQRRLAAPRRSHHQQDFAAGDLERDVDEGADRRRSGAVGLADAGDGDGRCHGD